MWRGQCAESCAAGPEVSQTALSVGVKHIHTRARAHTHTHTHKYMNDSRKSSELQIIRDIHYLAYRDAWFRTLIISMFGLVAEVG